jgi:tetrahydromethanopterin S-methyltransferase subunit G
MSYYDHSKWLVEQEKEIKRRLEEQEEKWAKEQKNIILGEIKQLKGNQGDLNKLYTKKEIAAIKKAELKELKKELMDEQKDQLKEAKREFEKSVKHYKRLIAQSKTDYNKTKKRLSKIDKENLDIIMEELNEKWEKQWGISKKGTRKNK